MNKNKRVQWKRGVGGEALTFAVIAPLVTFMICAVISIMQITLVRQNLMFSAYAACRAAVVSESQTQAQSRASGVMKALSPTSRTTFSSSGTIATSKGKNVSCVLSYASKPADSSKSNWQKGQLLKCTASQYIATAMPFTSGTYMQSVVMMIENSKKENYQFDIY